MFFFQAEDGIRDDLVTGVQTCALPICCNRSMGGSWTSYNLSPWVAGLQLTCCWGQEEWSRWRVGWREVGQQNALGLWQRWQGSWVLLSEGGVGRKMVQCISCLWRLVLVIGIHHYYHRMRIPSYGVFLL